MPKDIQRLSHGYLWSPGGSLSPLLGFLCLSVRHSRTAWSTSSLCVSPGESTHTKHRWAVEACWRFCGGHVMASLTDCPITVECHCSISQTQSVSTLLAPALLPVPSSTLHLFPFLGAASPFLEDGVPATLELGMAGGGLGAPHRARRQAFSRVPTACCSCPPALSSVGLAHQTPRV